MEVSLDLHDYRYSMMAKSQTNIWDSNIQAQFFVEVVVDIMENMDKGLSPKMGAEPDKADENTPNLVCPKVQVINQIYFLYWADFL